MMLEGRLSDQVMEHRAVKKTNQISLFAVTQLSEITFITDIYITGRKTFKENVAITNSQWSKLSI